MLGLGNLGRYRSERYSEVQRRPCPSDFAPKTVPTTKVRSSEALALLEVPASHRLRPNPGALAATPPQLPSGLRAPWTTRPPTRAAAASSLPPPVGALPSKPRASARRRVPPSPPGRMGPNSQWSTPGAGAEAPRGPCAGQAAGAPASNGGEETGRARAGAA